MSLPKILLVDDNELDRILYEEYLGKSNYIFEELEDGDLVLDHLKESIPDLMLLDWNMPRKDGLSVLKLLRKNSLYSTIPIIVITAMDSSDVLEKAFEYGCIDFIRKPVIPQEIVARVFNVISLKTSNAQLEFKNKELSQLHSIIDHQKEQLKKKITFQESRFDATEKNLKSDADQLVIKLKEEQITNALLHSELGKIKSTLQKLLIKIQNGSDDQSSKEVGSLIREISNFQNQRTISTKKLEVNNDPMFEKKLFDINSNLTSLDLQHCSYLRNKLSNHEIAEILGVELKSLQTSRYRLKKKLNVPEKYTLLSFLLSI